MPRYIITEKAGRFVAGRNNTGVGTTITLTEKQAEHEVRLGTLRPVKAPAEPDVAAEAEAPPEAGLGTDHLDALTVAELRDLAAARGIDLPGGARKADIVAAIAAEIQSE